MVSQLVAERGTAAMKAAPHGRCVDPEHPPGLLGSQTEPLDEDQRVSLAARELRERLSDILARRHGSAGILGRD
jgi:hypothetical protein